MAATVARLIGGAGTGKTTELLRIMDQVLPAIGNDPLRLGFASFTRAARAEAVGRAAAAWGVEEALLAREGWFRTIHSICYRLAGVQANQMVTNSEADLEWISNEIGARLCATYDEDTGTMRYSGDGDAAVALNCWSLARVTLRSLDEVVRRLSSCDANVPAYGSVLSIAKRYEIAKRTHDRIDYTDLLYRPLSLGHDPENGPYNIGEMATPPDVAVWMFDEQQDASPLLDMVCKWLTSAPSVRWAYVVGDPFQAVYGFAGSSSETFLGWPVSKQRIMPKSYRCAKPILDLGEQCLRRMRRGYFDRCIAPADHDGKVSRVSGLEAAVSGVNPEEDWLLIARTNFQANRIAAAMHEAGKPVRRTTSGDTPTIRSQGLAALYRLEQGEAISGSEWRRAVALLPSTNKAREKMLIRGAKTRWDNAEESKAIDAIYPNDESLTAAGATPRLLEVIRSGDWASLVDDGQRWRAAARRHGIELASAPRCRVGTIHSVKGAEADNVLLLTTTSKRVANGTEDELQADEECRIAYVAVTRARHNLCIVEDGYRGQPRMEV
jgi:DNA helicase-2/ATP-dependent DNA helicase PcrA